MLPQGFFFFFFIVALFGALVRKLEEVDLATFPLDSTGEQVRLSTADITRNDDVFGEG